MSTRRPPTHPVKPAYVLGPTRHLQGVHSWSALFLLDPFAAPSRFASKHDNDRVGDAKRLKQDALVAERNAQELSKLIGQIKAWRSGLGQETVVTIDTIPETVNNIIGTWFAKAIDHTGVEYYNLICWSNHNHDLVSRPDGKMGMHTAHKREVTWRPKRLASWNCR